MNRATAFTESPGLRCPIFQAPVGSVASEPGGRDFLRYDDVHEISPAHELMQPLWRDCRSADQSLHLHS